MISEFSTHARPTNRIAKVIFLVTSLVSIILFVLSTQLLLYRGIVAMFALMLLVTAVLFYTKYISAEFYYDVRCDGEIPPTFIVRQIIGKRETTLCRVELHHIIKVEYEDRETRRKHKRDADVKAYNYIPTVNPEGIVRMTVNNRYEHAEITVEGTREFSEMLLKYSVEARELYSDSFDDEE